jgi:hypothetical protein
VLFALITLTGFAALDHAWFAGASLGLVASALGLFIYADCALAMSQWRDAVDSYLRRDRSLCVVAQIGSANDHFQRAQETE